MPADEPLKPIEATVIWPTKEEGDRGLATIEKYAPTWKVNPALLLIKPEYALLVRLQNVEYDDHGFRMVAIEQTFMAPADFDSGALFPLAGIWNQPYMSLSSNGISAPYSFYLHFGTEEDAERLRQYIAANPAELGPDGFGVLRSAFTDGSSL